MSDVIPRYPLTWPTGWKRTPTHMRRSSPFKTSLDKAQRNVMQELDRLGAREIIVSSNLKLRNDGYPYASQPRCEDEGIAIYFTRKGKTMVFACDQYARREANMHAIGLSIAALRGLERWGASDMMERAFTGFTALPAPFNWRDVLGFLPGELPTRAMVEAAYKRLAMDVHPDRDDGDHDRMIDLNVARDEARKELQA
jgi:hypothetical protein